MNKDLFFPAYMDCIVEQSNYCVAKCNRKYGLGMIYFEGYYNNPIHVSASEKQDIFSEVKSAIESVRNMMNDSKTLKKKKHAN